MRIAILGSNGWIGGALMHLLSRNGNSVIPITRSNYTDYKNESFDIFINAAGNKYNYWANKFPNKDFEGSASLVYNSLFDFKIDKYVFLSSIAVYDKNSHYGWNKEIAEQIIKRFSDRHIILRCCHIIDKDMDTGIIYDMINGKEIFLSQDSRIQLMSKMDLINIIDHLINIDYNGTLCVGGSSSFRLGDIKQLISKDVKFKDDSPERHYEMNVENLSLLYPIRTSIEYVKEVI